MKKCRECLKTKEDEYFYSRRQKNYLGIRGNVYLGLSPKCRECHLKARAKYVETHKEECRASNERCRAKPKNRKKAVRVSRLWRKNHPGYSNEYRRNNIKQKTFIDNKTRAKRLKRIMKWSDIDAIKDFYLACPDGHEVDHIVPYRSKNVSGLHVLNNLQYLTPRENKRKFNKVITLADGGIG